MNYDINHINMKKNNNLNNNTIINDIKNYYKKKASINNDYKYEIESILKLNLVNYNNELYCDVLYKLNNNNIGNRRFAITKNGTIINMGNLNSGTTVI